FPQTPAPRRLERRRIVNDTTIRSIKPPAKGAVDYFDDLTPGLSLRVTSGDVRTWTVFYRDKSPRQKPLALGRYPGVKLVDARELARNAQRSVAHGSDPAVEETRRARSPDVWRPRDEVHRRPCEAEEKELAGGSASARRRLATEVEEAAGRGGLRGRP